MELAFGIGGLATAIVSIIISIITYNHNKIEALNSYFNYDRNEQFMKGRREVYNMDANTIVDNNDTNIATVLNAYHHWGLLVKHKQLPFWIFYDKRHGLTSSGITIARTYKKLQKTIKERQKSNKYYAQHYEYLYHKIYQKCTNEEKRYIDEF